MKYEIAVHWFPSTLLVTKEHVIISSLECPKCRQKTLNVSRQEALPLTTNLPYPIGGDKLFCKCESCGHPLLVEFIFREARPDDDPFKDFEQVYMFLLDRYASNQVPDYNGFTNNLLMIIEDIRINKPSMLEQILEKFRNDLLEFSSKLGIIKDLSVINKFKLVSFFISKLPEKEFKWIAKKVPEKIYNSLQDLREGA
jgi:hypothetical protein